MNGTRMNQSVAPTNFITSISVRRENMAVRMVFQMRMTATARRTSDMPIVTIMSCVRLSRFFRRGLQMPTSWK